MMSYPLLLVFIISYFLHLTSRLPALGVIRFDFVLACLILLALFFESQPGQWRLSFLPVRKLYMFFAYILLSLPLVTWPGSVINFNLVTWFKVSLVFLYLVTAVRSEQQFRLLVFVFLGCQVFRIFEPLHMHITQGYWGDIAYSHVGGVMSGMNRLAGAPHDVVNSTQLAWVIVSTIPFLFYLLGQGSKFAKALFACAAPFLVYALLLTGARSGLICLFVVVFTMIYLSRNRMKNFFISIVFLLPLLFLTMGNLSTDLQTRYLSLVDSSVVGADTAVGRVNSLMRQLTTLSNNPLFGNGLGTSRETNWNVAGGSSQITHNLYLEILQETGLVGFFLFAIYILSIMKCLQDGKRLLLSNNLEREWLFRMMVALQVWVVMNLVYSLSCFGLRSWEWYFFGGLAVLCLAFARERCPALEDHALNVSEG